MKNIIQLFYLIISLTLFAFLTSCSDDDNPTEPNTNNQLIGTWKISKMIFTSPVESGVYSESQLDSLGLIWNLTFNSDKTAEQVTNLSGPLTTQSGKWSISGDELILILNSPTGNEVGTMKYLYALQSGLLELSWELPEASKFVAEFKKN